LLRAWLLRVTLNVARNTLRGQSRSVARDSEYQKESDQVWFALAPEEDYERRVALEEARRALDKVQRADEKLPVAETAGAFHIERSLPRYL